MSLGRFLDSRIGKLPSVAAALIVAVAGGLTASLPAQAQDRGVVRIAIEGAFPPFSYIDAVNELQGFDVDIAKALCESAKLTCRLVVQPWDDMIPNLLSGKYDAIISSMSNTEERRKQVSFTSKYYNSPATFTVGKNSGIEDVSPDALKGKRIGAQKNTIQWKYLERLYATSAEIIPFEASEEGYTALAEGKIDAMFDDKFSGLDWLTNTKVGRCCQFAGPDFSDPRDFGKGAGVAFRPADKDLGAIFDKAIVDIQANGTYDMINAKYFPFSIR